MPMSSVAEQVQEWTREQQQVRQHAERVAPVLTQQIEGDDQPDHDGRNPRPAAAGWW